MLPSKVEQLLDGYGIGAFDGLTPAEIEVARYEWELWARPLDRLPDGRWRGQLPPPGDWDVWLFQGGRGSGKTRTGSEWCRDLAESQPGCRMALAAPTHDDVMATMVDGDSGILACCPPWNRPVIQERRRRLLWKNGSKAYFMSADEPQRFRGKQFHFSWFDELGASRYAEAWDQLQLCMRLGKHPRSLITTTPVRSPQLKKIQQSKATAWTCAYLQDNAAFLSQNYVGSIVEKYRGTSMWNQEILGEMLEDIDGALWRTEQIDSARVAGEKSGERKGHPVDVELSRIVIAVDPSASSKDRSALAGIAVCGLGSNGHAYVLEDLTFRATPDTWASRVSAAYHRWKADAVLAETNHGAEMVTSVMRTVDDSMPVKVINASRGKLVRAEPVAALYEQGRVHHVGNEMGNLEAQLTTWVPGATRVRRDGVEVEERSPDRMDALVYALTELMLQQDGFYWP